MAKQIFNLKHRLNKVVFVFIIVTVSSVFSGCGNKGDLYLPEKGSIDESTSNNVKKKS